MIDEGGYYPLFKRCAHRGVLLELAGQALGHTTERPTLRTENAKEKRKKKPKSK